jgi:deazaflavin-dependent oxidoreductase (nitroreductase family)
VRLTRILPKGLLGSSVGAAVGKRVFPRTDLVLQRWTRGRFSLTAATVGIPLLLLETVGRRTGEPRSTPLIYAAQGAGFIVAGSNWGQRRPPGWVLNLLDRPEAVVSVRGTRVAVRARRLEGAERDEAWPLLLELWPAYDEYAARVRATSGREIMVFRLERS